MKFNGIDAVSFLIFTPQTVIAVNTTEKIELSNRPAATSGKPIDLSRLTEDVLQDQGPLTLGGLTVENTTATEPYESNTTTYVTLHRTTNTEDPGGRRLQAPC